MSIGEAAVTFGVHRRTVERALRERRLIWHGASRRGRYARGLLLAEVGAALGARQATEPAVAQVARRLRWCDWRSVMRPVILAAAGGADVDLLAAAAGAIRFGDQAFLRAVSSGERCDGYSGALATAILTAARAAEVSDSTVSNCMKSFPLAWRTLARLMVRSPVKVRAALAFQLDRNGSNRLTLRFAPTWKPAGRMWIPQYASSSVVNPLRALRGLSADLPGVQGALGRVGAAVHDKTDVVVVHDLVSRITMAPRIARGSPAVCRLCMRGRKCALCLEREHFRSACEGVGVEPLDVAVIARAVNYLGGGTSLPRGDNEIEGISASAGKTATRRARERRELFGSRLRLSACRADVARALGISRAAVQRIA